jgi:hypothetical protein
MNWPNLASTKAQQAPVPGTMQSSRLSPVQTALMKAQSMIGGTIHNNKRAVNDGQTVSLGDAKRFSFSQPDHTTGRNRWRHSSGFLQSGHNG